MSYLTVPVRTAIAAMSVFLITSPTVRKPIGPPPPAIVFITHQNVTDAMQALSRVLEDSGYVAALRSSSFVTTVPRILREGDGNIFSITLSASIIPATDDVSVVMIWGKQANNSTGESGYIINGDSRAPTGDDPWDAMDGIHAAVLQMNSQPGR